MIAKTATVTSVEALGPHYFLVRLHAPEQATQTVPGHFYMLGFPNLPHALDPLLNRPISAFDVSGNLNGPQEVHFLIKQVGRGTTLLKHLKPGESILVHGPLGHPFPHPEARQRVILVGGGVGIAPLYFCARQFKDTANLTVFYGGRTAEEMPVRDWFGPSVKTVLSTEDGSLGYHGRVTEPLAQALAEDASGIIYCCGPNPMMAAVHQLAISHDIPVLVSMENRMGCGMGICLGCVIPTHTRETSTMSRVCCDGPVFNSRLIRWDALDH